MADQHLQEHLVLFDSFLDERRSDFPTGSHFLLLIHMAAHHGMRLTPAEGGPTDLEDLKLGVKLIPLLVVHDQTHGCDDALRVRDLLGPEAQRRYQPSEVWD